MTHFEYISFSRRNPVALGRWLCQTRFVFQTPSSFHLRSAHLIYPPPPFPGRESLQWRMKQSFCKCAVHVWKRSSHFESHECSAIHHVIRFKPTSGTIREIKFRSTPKVWGYFSVGSNGGIHEFADSQFGHLFSTGTDREDARKHLIIALKVSPRP